MYKYKVDMYTPTDKEYMLSKSAETAQMSALSISVMVCCKSAPETEFKFYILCKQLWVIV